MKKKLTYLSGKASLKDWDIPLIDEWVSGLRDLVHKAVVEVWNILSDNNGISADLPMIFYPDDGRHGAAPDDPLTIRLSLEIGDWDDANGGCVYFSFSLSELIEQEIEEMTFWDLNLEGYRKIRDQLQHLSAKLSAAIDAAIDEAEAK